MPRSSCFASVPKIRRVLQTLHDVGLGYIPLGQAAPTLSGGEAQRVKLAAELARPDTGSTLYILDEPTTGLHFDDVRKLLAVVHRLADLGNTVVIIEHNLEVIKTADWVIDLGPEAGLDGGQVVAAGPPERIAETRGSLTGPVLKGVLAAGPPPSARGSTPRPPRGRPWPRSRRPRSKSSRARSSPPGRSTAAAGTPATASAATASRPAGTAASSSASSSGSTRWARSLPPTGRNAPASGSAGRKGVRPCSSRR